jgi:golgi phosphoprotein 3
MDSVRVAVMSSSSQPAPSRRIHEEILLLGLDDDKGKVEARASSTLTYALAGAVVAELCLLGDLTLKHERKKVFVQANATGGTGDPVLDDCLGTIRVAKRRKQAKDWIAFFASKHQLRHRVADELVQKGILDRVEGKILFLFRSRRYPESDPRPERLITERLRDAIFDDAASIDDRTAVLVSLAHAAKLLPIKFPKRDLRRRKAHIEAIARGDAAGTATRAAIEAAEALGAAIAASTAAAAAAAASSS